MVLAHAAFIASDLPEGELICPFAIITKDDRRQVVPFEAESQAEAVENGKASLSEFKDQIDYWGFGREGLWSDPDATDRTDVLIVSTWTHGMEEPVILMQRFRPAATDQFLLLGAVDIVIDGHVLTPENAAPLRALVSDGIAMHPSAVPWASWLVH
ncbi:hypothetical protein [Lysobacter sp. P5_B9]